MRFGNVDLCRGSVKLAFEPGSDFGRVGELPGREMSMKEQQSTVAGCLAESSQGLGQSSFRGVAFTAFGLSPSDFG